MATLEFTLDGIRINGRPALSVETVQSWFKNACNREPSFDTASAIAKGLNHCGLFEYEWKNTLEVKEMRKSNPSRMRMKRVAEALRTLRVDLPVILNDSRKAAKADQLDPLMKLIESVAICAPYFEVYLEKARGRERERWHNIARNLSPLVKDAFTSCGIKRAGFGKDTSPGVIVMQSALAHLGVHTTPAAIVEAIRQRPKRGGKIDPAIRQTS